MIPSSRRRNTADDAGGHVTVTQPIGRPQWITRSELQGHRENRIPHSRSTWVSMGKSRIRGEGKAISTPTKTKLLRKSHPYREIGYPRVQITRKVKGKKKTERGEGAC